MKKYYISPDGTNPQGPFTEEDILKQLQSGQLNYDQLIWCEGMDSYDTVENIFSRDGSKKSTDWPKYDTRATDAIKSVSCTIKKKSQKLVNQKLISKECAHNAWTHVKPFLFEKRKLACLVILLSVIFVLITCSLQSSDDKIDEQSRSYIVNRYRFIVDLPSKLESRRNDVYRSNYYDESGAPRKTELCKTKEEMFNAALKYLWKAYWYESRYYELGRDRRRWIEKIESAQKDHLEVFVAEYQQRLYKTEEEIAKAIFDGYDVYELMLTGIGCPETAFFSDEYLELQERIPELKEVLVELYDSYPNEFSKSKEWLNLLLDFEKNISDEMQHRLGVGRVLDVNQRARINQLREKIKEKIKRLKDEPMES